MTKATVKQYSVSLTSWFVEPIPLRDAGLENIAKKLLLRFGGYGLRCLDILQRQGDRLFDYDLTFALFNRNGSFRLSAEGIHIAFQNARDEQDAGIISDCLVGFVETLSERRIRESKLEALVHTSVGLTEVRDTFLLALGPSGRKLPVGGCVFYFPAVGAFGEARLLVDRSLLFPDGVFLNWGAPFSQALSPELLNQAQTDFQRLCGEIGLDFGNT